MIAFKTTIKRLRQDAQPLDQIAVVLMAVLSVLIGVVVWSGDHSLPQIQDFSWAQRRIGAEDSGFILNFTRPMERDSVEQNLTIKPPLPGKISWSGRRMAYTLLQPAPYGTEFTLTLENARDQLYGKETGQVMEPFTSTFQTRDRAFAYLGIQGEEDGRLMFVNLTQEKIQPMALTPAEIRVIAFEPYATGDRILFSGITEDTLAQGLPEPQLFTVTTGLPGNYDSDQSPVPGTITPILDNKNYHNLKFDLSPDGETIVIQRASKTDPGDTGPWIIKSGHSPERLNIEGGDFLIAPDSQSLIIAQGPNLTTIVPLKPDAEPLEFLSKFGQVLSFARDGSAATMVRFNPDGTRSLFLVTTQGEERELYRTPPFGNILSAEFDPNHNALYCLLTELLDTQAEYQEQPYIALINLETDKLLPLIILPEQQEINMSLAPDGLALLFDQAVTATADVNGFEEAPRTVGGDRINTSRLWLLPLELTLNQGKPQLQPEELPFPGYSPAWLP
ncbi:MAG: hypothetical protein HC835_03590 [Oscillatoriales cyanobacterium RM2_1_1]|nr:hypothetical protein [Oscillatoriales cyanobacterium SM2_3_0]NJO44772.1 hypothetical protein [Oscillatoriales cyanobacterium RM2_1_1]